MYLLLNRTLLLILMSLHRINLLILSNPSLRQILLTYSATLMHQRPYSSLSLIILSSNLKASKVSHSLRLQLILLMRMISEVSLDRWERWLQQGILKTYSEASFSTITMKLTFPRRSLKRKRRSMSFGNNKLMEIINFSTTWKMLL